MRRNSLWAALVVVVAALTVTAGAGAIIGGEPTGPTRYSNVGITSNGCSGTLVSPTVFLTAAHCVFVEGGQQFVTFESDSNGDVPVISGTAHADRRFLDPLRQGGTAGFIGQTDFDFAVIVLDGPAAKVFPGITPAVLPTLNLLDGLAKSAKAKDSAAFTSVGYGLWRDPFLLRNPHNFVDFGVRRMTTEPLFKLDPTLLWVRANVNAAWADGGGCYGDSGGPVFLGTSNTIVSVQSFGVDPGCLTLGGGARLDTASARSFLGTYVALP